MQAPPTQHFWSAFSPAGCYNINMKSDGELLRHYAKAHSDDAFTELVKRHVNLVYSAALRQVNGDTHLAQDVAQTVFADLARKAASLSDRAALAGWLYTCTHFAAAKAVRTESRRRNHEQQAHAMQDLVSAPPPDSGWEQLRPVLDAAMHELSECERELLLARYFEQRRLTDMGKSLGLGEDAVRKRVERALEKLRRLLLKRGIPTGAAFAEVVAAHAVQPTPAALAATLSSGALAAVSVNAAATATITKTVALTMTTLQKTALVALFAVLAGAGLYEARQVSRLRQEIQALRQNQADLTARLEQANTSANSYANQPTAAASAILSTERLRELLRLRGEIGVLRRQQRELEQALAGQSARPQVQASTASRPSNAPAPFQVQLVADEPGENTELMTNNPGTGSGPTLYVNRTPLLDHTAIRSVNVVRSPSSGQPEISIELSDEGKELFAAITRENVNKRLAIVLNGQVYSAPVIRSEITGGKAQITGNFTEQEAQQLADKISEAIRDQ